MKMQATHSVYVENWLKKMSKWWVAESPSLNSKTEQGKMGGCHPCKEEKEQEKEAKIWL